jgi:hypothetical protein
MSDPQDLSGVWYGRYDGASQSNRFIARLDERAGAVVGIITEPDTSGASDIRRAYVSGRRQGAELDFVKQYDGAVYAHSVRYAGIVNADATEVSGSWRIVGSHGSFVMTREKFDEAELDEAEEIEVEVRQ